MKSILYAGAALMIGASVYGFVDYKQNQNKKQFKEMYVDHPVPVAKTLNTATVQDEKKEEVVIEKSKKENDQPVINKTVVKKTTVKKSKKKSKRFDIRMFSRAPLKEDMEVVPAPKEIEPVKKDQ